MEGYKIEDRVENIKYWVEDTEFRYNRQFIQFDILGVFYDLQTLKQANWWHNQCSLCYSLFCIICIEFCRRNFKILTVVFYFSNLNLFTQTPESMYVRYQGEGFYVQHFNSYLWILYFALYVFTPVCDIPFENQ